jgi:hypothetical protein
MPRFGRLNSKLSSAGQFSVKSFVKYFSGKYCATIRDYSAKRRHYSISTFQQDYVAVPTSKTCAIIRPSAQRVEKIKFGCSVRMELELFFDKTSRKRLCAIPPKRSAPVPGRSNEQTAERVKQR